MQFSKELVHLANKKSNQRQAKDADGAPIQDDLSAGSKVFEFIRTGKAG